MQASSVAAGIRRHQHRSQISTTAGIPLLLEVRPIVECHSFTIAIYVIPSIVRKLKPHLDTPSAHSRRVAAFDPLFSPRPRAARASHRLTPQAPTDRQRPSSDFVYTYTVQGWKSSHLIAIGVRVVSSAHLECHLRGDRKLSKTYSLESASQTHRVHDKRRQWRRTRSSGQTQLL
jgi:hypothetical protein